MNSENFARVLYAKFRENKTRDMARSLRCLLIYVTHALVANFERRKYVFWRYRGNKSLAKISEFTVTSARNFRISTVYV